MSLALGLGIGAGVALLMGGVLLALGIRGRVADALVYCRRCRFCLDGIERSECPELSLIHI